MRVFRMTFTKEIKKNILKMLTKFNSYYEDMRFVKTYFERLGTGIDTYYDMVVPHGVQMKLRHKIRDVTYTTTLLTH